MATWRPDPTFYPSPRMAMKAPPETLAYVASFDPRRAVPDAIAVVDVDPDSKTYSQIVGTVTMPNVGDELHHFGWNACCSCLCPIAPHPLSERRYLIVPGLRSSRIHILDTKATPREPKIVRNADAGHSDKDWSCRRSSRNGAVRRRRSASRPFRRCANRSAMRDRRRSR